MRPGVGSISPFDGGAGFVDKGSALCKVDTDFCRAFSESFLMCFGQDEQRCTAH